MDPNAIPNTFRELMGFNAGSEVTYEDDDADDSIPPIQKITKKNNALPLWGNTTTMNLNTLVLENIVQSAFYKNYLVEVTTFQQAADEIHYNVSHLEPWERNTRKAPGTGMCGGVRGVSSGGVISTAFCVLYKLFTMRVTRKQLVSMVNSSQSVYMRGVAFLYIRFCQPPADVLQWMEPYLDDDEEIDPRAGGGDKMTVGQMLRQMLTKLDWYGTLFPRLPFSIQKEIEARFGDKSHSNIKLVDRKRGRSPVRSVDQGSSVTHRKKRCGHHLRHHHCRKHRNKCPSKAKKLRLEGEETKSEKPTESRDD